MGLFGRDDQPSDTKTDTTRPQSRPAPVSPPSGNSNRTVISQKIKIDGAVSGTGEITVNGYVHGTIDGAGTVHVAEDGRVEATVHATNVVVAGQVTGNVTADEKIELEQSARVHGDITAPRILIRDGAAFRGQVNMRKPSGQKDPQTSSARKDPDAKTQT